MLARFDVNLQNIDACGKYSIKFRIDRALEQAQILKKAQNCMYNVDAHACIRYTLRTRHVIGWFIV